MAVADRRIWRTDDGRYVEDGDPAAAVLVAAAGDPLPDDYSATKQAPKPPNKARRASRSKPGEPTIEVDGD